MPIKENEVCSLFFQMVIPRRNEFLRFPLLLSRKNGKNVFNLISIINTSSLCLKTKQKKKKKGKKGHNNIIYNKSQKAFIIRNKSISGSLTALRVCGEAFELEKLDPVK